MRVAQEMQPHEIKTRVFDALNLTSIKQEMDAVLVEITRNMQRQELIIDRGNQRFIIGLTVRQEKP